MVATDRSARLLLGREVLHRAPQLHELLAHVAVYGSAERRCCDPLTTWRGRGWPTFSAGREPRTLLIAFPLQRCRAPSPGASAPRAQAEFTQERGINGEPHARDMAHLRARGLEAAGRWRSSGKRSGGCVRAVTLRCMACTTCRVTRASSRMRSRKTQVPCADAGGLHHRRQRQGERLVPVLEVVGSRRQDRCRAARQQQSARTVTVELSGGDLVRASARDFDALVVDGTSHAVWTFRAVQLTQGGNSMARFRAVPASYVTSSFGGGWVLVAAAAGMTMAVLWTAAARVAHTISE